MMLLALMLAVNAVLHFAVVGRFGLAGRANVPVFIYAFIYGALAIAVWMAVPYVLWAVLVFGGVGFAALTATFNSIDREKSLDRAIWLLDAVMLAWVVYLLFFA
ncbi:hypothetical protein [Oricola sp.]|uniref:hypothetical protein n=1 Tax=Oricola sp. TaxID=1979950 RepID=UPI003BA85A91